MGKRPVSLCCTHCPRLGYGKYFLRAAEVVVCPKECTPKTRAQKRRNELSNPNSPAQTYLQTHILNQPSLCSWARHKLSQCWFLAPTLVYDLGDHSQLLTAMAAFLPWELILEFPTAVLGNWDREPICIRGSCAYPLLSHARSWLSSCLQFRCPGPWGPGSTEPLSSCLFLCSVWIPSLPPNVLRSKQQLGWVH